MKFGCFYSLFFYYLISLWQILQPFIVALGRSEIQSPLHVIEKAHKLQRSETSLWCWRGMAPEDRGCLIHFTISTSHFGNSCLLATSSGRIFMAFFKGGGEFLRRRASTDAAQRWCPPEWMFADRSLSNNECYQAAARRQVSPVGFMRGLAGWPQAGEAIPHLRQG